MAGRVGTKEDNKTIADILNEMHVSSVSGVIITLAGPESGGEKKVVLMFESCCGGTAYALPIDMASDMRIGIDGALARLAELEDEQNASEG